MEETNSRFGDQLDVLRTGSWEIIDKHNVALPNELYHYTTIESLLNIVGASTLWATDVRFFNDWREIEYGLNTIGHIQNARLESGLNDSTTHVIFDAIGPITLIKYSEVFRKCHFYAACFSTNGDDLYQWRAYSDATKGHAVGFCLGDSGLDVCKVIYDKVDQERITNDLIDAWMEHLRAVDLTEASTRAEISRLLRSMIFRLALTFKDNRFAAEQEWRILVGHANENVQYRKGRFGLTPYVSLNLCPSNSSRMPIVSVIQGHGYSQS